MENQFNIEELKKFLAETVDTAVKEHQLTKTDLKFAKLPGSEEVDTKDLTPKQAKEKIFRKYISDVITNKAYNTEASGAVGQYLVPVEFGNEVFTLLNKYGLFRQHATNFNMSRQKVQFPKLNATVSGAWVAEAAAKTTSNPTFTQVTFTRNTYAFITPVSRELLQDSAIDLVSYFSQLAALDFAKAEDTAGFVGSGSPITGITSASGTNAVVLTGTLAATLEYEKLIDCISGVHAETLGNSAWYMHPSVWGSILKIEDGAQRPLIDAIQNGITPTLYGYPVRLSTVLASTAVTAVSTPYIIFGDLKYSYLGSREGIQLDVADQATIGSDNLFVKNLLAFRFEESLDIQIVFPEAFSVLKSAAA